MGAFADRGVQLLLYCVTFQRFSATISTNIKDTQVVNRTAKFYSCAKKYIGVACIAVE